MKNQQLLQAALVFCAVTLATCIRKPLSHSTLSALEEEDLGFHEHELQRDPRFEQLTRLSRRMQQDEAVATGDAGTAVGVVSSSLCSMASWLSE